MHEQSIEHTSAYTSAFSPLFKSYVTIKKIIYNHGTKIYDCDVFDSELNESFPAMFADYELENFK